MVAAAVLAATPLLAFLLPKKLAGVGGVCVMAACYALGLTFAL